MKFRDERQEKRKFNEQKKVKIVEKLRNRNRWRGIEGSGGGGGGGGGGGVIYSLRGRDLI